METLKYTVIKNVAQYKKYCDILEELILGENDDLNDEIELLTLLIEKWDMEQNSFMDSDPVLLLKGLMEEHELKAKDLSGILDLSKGTVSKILNYHKGLSKETIRKLSDYFKLSQEAFNRPYRLVNQTNNQIRKANRMSTKKNRIEA
jgi:HTH-type transcriptional regulator/antitoxin HigA